MKLALRQTQRVVMTPLLQQAIQLLQLSTLELEQVVQKELEENPLLEEVPIETEEAQTAAAPGATELPPTPAPSEPVSKEAATVDAERADELPFDLSAAMFDEPDERTPVSMEEREDLPFENLSGNETPSLTEHLMEQLRFTAGDPVALRVGEAIIGNLDEDGYLRAELAEIAEGTGSSPAGTGLRAPGRGGAERAGVSAPPADRRPGAGPRIRRDPESLLRGPGTPALRRDRAGDEAAAGPHHGIRRGDPGARAQARPPFRRQ